MADQCQHGFNGGTRPGQSGARLKCNRGNNSDIVARHFVPGSDAQLGTRAAISALRRNFFQQAQFAEENLRDSPTGVTVGIPK
jgi:hypothetical protein